MARSLPHPAYACDRATWRSSANWFSQRASGEGTESYPRLGLKNPLGHTSLASIKFHRLRMATSGGLIGTPFRASDFPGSVRKDMVVSVSMWFPLTTSWLLL